jgi:hypothetical protein
MKNDQRIGGCVTRDERPIATPVNVQRFLNRVGNDRWAEDEVSHGGDPVTEPVARQSFNRGSQHVESLFLQWINEARMPAALEELAEAPCLDLRLKNALIGGGV